MADRVSVFEVGARDGFQNEPRTISLEDKLWFARELARAGIRDLELGAFVRPDRVPQMADTDELYRRVRGKGNPLGEARAWALVPNRRGLERAIAAGVNHLAVFTAATESFARRNIGMSIDESLREFAEVIREARAHFGTRGPGAAKIRGYVSTAFGCPFEGEVSARQALRVIGKLADLGVDQVSIGDTIGVATPSGRRGGVREVVEPALRLLGPKCAAVHFHDTRGTALANTLRSLDLGVRIVDSSAGGLGGCPFAPGATGNLATEDLVYMLEGMGMRTGIDLARLAKASIELGRRINRPLSSRYLVALSAPCA